MAFRDENYLTTHLFPWCKSGDVDTTVDADSLPLLMPGGGRVLGVRAVIASPPTGANLIADLHQNGVTMFTTQANRPTILATELDSGAWAVPDVTAFAAGDRLTVNVDAIGTTLPGTALTVEVRVWTRC